MIPPGAEDAGAPPSPGDARPSAGEMPSARSSVTAMPGGLVVLESAPFNAESPLQALAESPTPTPLFYVRNHFEVPSIDLSTWRLGVEGAVERAFEVSLDDLRELPRRSVDVTLECAGNGRAKAAPRTPGTPWGWGAVGTARFTGAPLRLLLERAGLRADAAEILFRGADRGEVAPGRNVAFERSLTVEKALDADVLLAWEMNGDPLTPAHGSPLRVVVPGWYGVASVKWLTGVCALAERFEGYFQRERYIYRGEAGTPDGAPVSSMRVRSVIASPADGARLDRGSTEIAGTAWSGSGPVGRVEVSFDGGLSWSDADLGPPSSPTAARTWRFRWTPPRSGAFTLLSRATGAAGERQPLEPIWNELGYGNNVVQRVGVRIVEQTGIARPA